MIRIEPPDCTFDRSIDDCISGISANLGEFIERMLAGRSALLEAGEIYIRAMSSNEGLPAIRPFLGEGADVVVASITKADLYRMYEEYFVPKKKRARRIYDKILASAADRCPFCGGIGRPRNLDHFLPKAYFPQFSVMPLNLVPICRDCNFDGKGDRYASSISQVPIQPYLDSDRFFSEQWIFATFYPEAGSGGFLEYFVSAPDSWSDAEKERALNHFRDFDLAKRFSIKAAEQLNSVLSQIEKMADVGLDEAAISSVLLASISASDMNNWRRCMFQAIVAARTKNG